VHHVDVTEHGDRPVKERWVADWVAASSRQKDGTWIFHRVTARVTSAAQAGASASAGHAPGQAGRPARGDRPAGMARGGRGEPGWAPRPGA
jgi:hypothetical protein